MSNVNIEKEIIMLPINSIKPYVRNPRKNSKTIELLTKLIPKVGFNVPLVIDEKGVIVKGHARFAAAIHLDMQEVPCIITHADEEAIKVDRITDNKISEFSEWVNDELIQEINDMEFDLSDLGLPKVSLDDVLEERDAIEEERAAQEAEAKAREGISEEQKQKLFEEFRQQQTEEQAKESVEAMEKFYTEAYYKCVCEKCGYITYIKEHEVDGFV